MGNKGEGTKTLAENRKARHDYFIEEVYEAGIVLVGTEVKSVRQGKANLKDSYADIKDSEIWVRNLHISPYEKGNIFNKDPLRDRKLLMHRDEIRRLLGYISQKGYTFVPLSMYLKNGRVKVSVAVAKGKKDYDKRDSMLEKAAKRDIEREFRDRQKY